MRNIRLDDRRISIDDQFRLMAVGEVHYFRLARQDWAHRLRLLREAGGRAVATYVPWVVHERADAAIDVTGRTDPRLDVGAFLDLAAELGLDVLLRPGPFVMAEMAGEGVPDRVRREHPEILPLGWQGRPGPTPDVDYLAPSFLAETRRWYEALGQVVAPRMAPRGGPVIAVQLDNEIGMLAWVSNTPHLTDRACRDLLAWLRDRYGAALPTRYPGLPTDEPAFAAAVREPVLAWTTQLRLDLGRFSRDQRGRYADHLAELATAAGMGGVPFLLNIHGTSAGSGATFPIGISQVVQAYAGQAQRTAGSDHYLGDLTLRTAADLHLINTFMAASAPDQPMTSLELEAGTGDYGDDLWADVDPSAVVLKTRLSLAQGHRLLNLYLFAGGTNDVADPPRTDGTTRFAITGERHGFAAPVDPEGRVSRSYPATAEAMAVTTRLEPWLADADEEHDDLALGMVLDHYLTEYRPPGEPGQHPSGVGELEYARGAGPRGLLGRVLLTLGYRYGAVDLQAADSVLPHLVVLGSPSALDRPVQERLAAHLQGGGTLLLLGALPMVELDGTPCTVLAEALDMRVVGLEQDRPGWFTSVTSAWGHGTELRVGRAEMYEAPGAQVVLAEAMSGRPTGVLVSGIGPGGGRALVIGCDLGADLALFATALERLGVSPGLRRTVAPGLLATTTLAADGSRLLHVLNVSGSPVTTAFELAGEPLLGGTEVTVPPRTGLALPVGVRVAGRELSATVEVESEGDGVVRLLGPGRVWVDGREREAVDGRVSLA